MIEEVRGYYSALGTDYPQPNLFTLSMGDDADNSVPAMLACAFHGVWASVSDAQDPLSQLASFFAFFALALTNEDRTVWSDIYEDASGAGLVTTASRAVFRQGGGALVGVVGIDVSLASLLGVSTRAQIESAIALRSQQCMVTLTLTLTPSPSPNPSPNPNPNPNPNPDPNPNQGHIDDVGCELQLVRSQSA